MTTKAHKLLEEQGERLLQNGKGRKAIDANHGRNKMEGELMEKIDA
jgi:hypothetical protein